MSATSTTLPMTVFTNWLAFGERGLSSEAIVSHLTGQRVGRWSRGRHLDTPSDPDDFRRCQLLLREAPLARVVFAQMRTASPEWARLVDAWDDIHAAIEADAPGYVTRQPRRGSASPRGFHIIQCALADGTLCQTCDATGRGAECPKCKGTGRRSGGRCRADGCYRGAAYCPSCGGRGYVGGDR